MSPRGARIVALVGPSLLIALFTLSQQNGLIYTAGQILLGMWITTLGALVILALDPRASSSMWERIDVLTSTGAAMMTSAAAAVALAAVLGWASLAVVGVLGVGAVYLAVIWTALVASSDTPWKRAKVERTITPDRAVEGEPLKEQITLRDIAIAPGMRLFVTGRAMKHGSISRYAVDSRASRSELKLESELGPALRGEHHAAPLELWLGDVFGLTRTPSIHRGEATFTVLPKPMQVDNAQHLLGAGGVTDAAMPAHALPTEGVFKIREYVEGDDTRRIHWLRSLASNKLVVRLPDEVPPADPAVRLILDNELAGVETLACRAPADMLDALVRVWLGIGKALADRGTRVTLVAAVGDSIKERTLVARAPRTQALQLGAQVAWQAVVPWSAAVRDRSERQIIVSCRPRSVSETQVSWVVVPEVAWTALEPPPARDPAVTYPFPPGSVENRSSRRTAAQKAALDRWRDLSVFSQVVCWTDWPRFAGEHVARRDGDRAVLEVIP